MALRGHRHRPTDKADGQGRECRPLLVRGDAANFPIVSWRHTGHPSPCPGRANQICSARPSPRNAASCTASPIVGWAWMIPATSSRRAPISIA